MRYIFPVNAKAEWMPKPEIKRRGSLVRTVRPKEKITQGEFVIIEIR